MMGDGLENLIQNRSVRKLSVLSAANSDGWISWGVITLEENVITFPSCVSFLSLFSWRLVRTFGL